jgi:hypothetical protein
MVAIQTDICLLYSGLRRSRHLLLGVHTKSVGLYLFYSYKSKNSYYIHKAQTGRYYLKKSFSSKKLVLHMKQ